MAHHNAVTAERFAGTHKLPLRSTALGVLGALAAFDQAKKFAERANHSNQPEFVSHENPGEHAIFVLPGCRTNGKVIAELLEPQLSKLGSTVYMAYPENRFSIEAIGRELIRKRQEVGKAKASIYAISMGGMVLTQLGVQPAFREAFGPLDTVVLDSSPHNAEDLRPKMQHLLTGANIVQHSHFASQLVQTVMAHISHHESGHEPGIDESLVARHAYSTAHAYMPFIAKEGKLINRQHGQEPNALQGWAKQVIYVHASHDDVIDIELASQRYAATYGGIIDITDTNRPHGSHAVGPEFPTGIMNLLRQPNNSRIAA